MLGCIVAGREARARLTPAPPHRATGAADGGPGALGAVCWGCLVLEAASLFSNRRALSLLQQMGASRAELRRAALRLRPGGMITGPGAGWDPVGAARNAARARCATGGRAAGGLPPKCIIHPTPTFHHLASVIAISVMRVGKPPLVSPPPPPATRFS